jgi:hypothetical protein
VSPLPGSDQIKSKLNHCAFDYSWIFKNKQVAEQLIANGFYLSFGKISTSKSNLGLFLKPF